MEQFTLSMLAAKEKCSLRDMRKEALQKEHDTLLERVATHGYVNLKTFVDANLLELNLEQEVLNVLLGLQEDCKRFMQQWHTFEKTIFVEPAKRHEAIQAMEALLKNTFKAGIEAGIFQRSGKLVRVLIEPTKNQLRKAARQIHIDQLDQYALTNIFDNMAFFETYKDNPEISKRINTPEQFVRLLLAKKQWDLPVLNSIIHTPTLREDGSILDKEGYDDASKLLFISNGSKFDKIPENPIHEDALKALEELKYPFSDFPFENDESLSVIICAILAGLIRPSLAAVPLTGISAPTMSSGKSLLAKSIAMIVTGAPCSAIPQADDEPEERKRMLAFGMRDERIISWDNVDRPFGNAVLCSAITESLIEDRKLGTNETMKVLINALFIVNGNNLTFTGDIATRALLAQLNPRSEHPEERENFKIAEELLDHILVHRPQLVKAGLTILRAYVVAGRPAHNQKPFGRFESWDKWIRGAAIWVGLADPCISRKAVEVEDPIRATLTSLLGAWHKTFGATPITIKKLIDAAISIPDSADADTSALRDTLKNALLELSGSNQEKINARALGKKLSSLKKRIANGFYLEQAGEYQNSVLWRVIEAKEKGK